MCLSSICSCCLTSAARSMGDCCCPKNSKLGYVMLMFLSVIVAIVLRYYGEDFMSNIYFYTFDVCTSGTCWGYEAVYRISFALCGFFIMMGCVVSCGTGAQCDSGFWCFKICAYVALLVTAWVLPNTFYDGYVEVARVISGVFLVLQIGLLINFAYMWNDDWIEKGWEKGILFISFLLYTGSGALMIVLFLYFGGSNCELNNFLIIFTIIFTVIFTGLSITDWIQHGALLPSGVVTLYCYWLVLSALQGDSSVCNQLSVNEDNYWEVAGSLLLAALSVTWAAWNLANKVGSNEEAQPLSPPRAKPSGDDEEKATGDGTTEMSGPPPAPTAEDRQDARDEANELAAEEGEKSARTNMKFHFVLAASSMYMAMVLTDWGSHQNEDDSKTSASMWITIVSQWVTGILYTWTLVAPYLFPDRDFGTAI